MSPRVPESQRPHVPESPSPRLTFDTADLIQSFREQACHIGESTRLPPMWSGFNSQPLCHMWVEFVGSLLCYERFFSRYCGFPPARFPHRSLLIRHTLLCFKKTIAITIDVLWDSCTLFFLLRGFFLSLYGRTSD